MLWGGAELATWERAGSEVWYLAFGCAIAHTMTGLVAWKRATGGVSGVRVHDGVPDAVNAGLMGLDSGGYPAFVYVVAHTPGQVDAFLGLLGRYLPRSVHRCAPMGRLGGSGVRIGRVSAVPGARWHTR